MNLKEIDKEPFLHYYERKFMSALISKIKELYPSIKEIIIFGSKARGDFTEDSDIDIVLITNRPIDKREKYDILDTISELEIEHNTLASILLISDRELKNNNKPIFREIKRNGIKVWSRESVKKKP